MAYRFEDGTVDTNVTRRRETQAANQTSAQVTDNVSVEVGQHHDVEHARVLDQLQHRGIERQLIVRNERVSRRCLTRALQEETVRQAPDPIRSHER